MFTLRAGQSILNALVGKSSSADLADTCYIGFSSTEPNIQGEGFTEPSTDAGYERILVGSYSQSLTQLFGEAVASEDGNSVTITNKENIKSNRAIANWGTLTHVLFFTAKTGGTLVAFQALTSPITVSTGESIQINKGTLELILR